jgi:alkanesulfonate monooxygenase SsuD/methylene tetrahydromethanopterin reductase-like flavin-dependent oxidoreductase (luciferase family)
MTISFSCRCPNANCLGFDAVFVNDHIIVDNSTRSAPWTNTCDPFVALSFMASNTQRIGVGVSVLIVPYRNPIATAKALATIDQMSGGRLICGVGVGWSEAEFAALGLNFHERGARINEYLRIWQACGAPGEATFEGRFFSFTNMHVSPKPLASLTHRSGSEAPAPQHFAVPPCLPKSGSRRLPPSPIWCPVRPRCATHANGSAGRRRRRRA